VMKLKLHFRTVICCDCFLRPLFFFSVLGPNVVLPDFLTLSGKKVSLKKNLITSMQLRKEIRTLIEMFEKKMNFR